MHPRTKSAALWGVVGALSFLVLLRGYAAITGTGISLPVTATGTLVIGIAAGVLSYIVEGRLLYDDPKGSR